MHVPSSWFSAADQNVLAALLSQGYPITALQSIEDPIMHGKRSQVGRLKTHASQQDSISSPQVLLLEPSQSTVINTSPIDSGATMNYTGMHSPSPPFAAEFPRIIASYPNEESHPPSTRKMLQILFLKVYSLQVADSRNPPSAAQDTFDSPISPPDSPLSPSQSITFRSRDISRVRVSGQ